MSGVIILSEEPVQVTIISKPFLKFFYSESGYAFSLNSFANFLAFANVRLKIVKLENLCLFRYFAIVVLVIPEPIIKKRASCFTFNARNLRYASDTTDTGL